MQEGNEESASQVPAIEELAPLFPAYELQEFIAEGGMGAVYLANQISLDRPVAIKILSRHLSDDPVFRASFEAEAKAMARMNHSNLIAVYDFGDADGLLYIVMEMVHGQSLHESAYGRTIDPVQAGDLVSQISRGIEHAHSQKVLHRDIKPGNILLDSEGHPKIGDFGLAQPMDQKGGEDETIYGTPGYAAPEVYQRKGDHRADIFAIGVVLHELLVGRLPDGSGAPPSSLCGCSRAFDEVFFKATNPNPMARYQTAGELADAIDKAVKQADASNASTNRLVLPSSVPVKVPVGGRVSGAPGVRVSSRAKAQAKAQIEAANQSSSMMPIWIVVGLIALGGMIFLATRGGGEDTDKQKSQASLAEQAEAAAKRAREARAEKRREKKEQEKNGGMMAPKPDPRFTKEEKEQPVRPVKPSPLVAMGELKAKLVAGERENFPPGTEERRGSHFVLVDQPMDWEQAKDFAEDHGAHLAVLPTAEDREWFVEKFGWDGPAWVGAGMGADNTWQWIDGNRWDEKTIPAVTAGEDLRGLSLVEGGLLQANDVGDSFPFAIQWRKDGKNPATTGEQLKRTVASIKLRGVDYVICPVGTQTYGVERSHFYRIDKAISWDEARKLAAAAGGALAVPAKAEESKWLRDAFRGGDAKLWLGGYRLKASDPWLWLTKEAWTYKRGWVGGSSPIDDSPGRLMLQLGGAGEGWVGSDGSAGKATGFIIEWSPPKAVAGIGAFNRAGWVQKTDKTFTERVEKEMKEYDTDFRLLADRYVRNMKRLGRKHLSAIAGKDGKGHQRRKIEELVRNVEDNDAILSRVSKSVPDEFHEYQKRSESDVDGMKNALYSKIQTQLDTYSNGLSKQADSLVKDGYAEDAEALRAIVGELDGDIQNFLTRLGLEDPTVGALVVIQKEDDDDK